MRQKVWHILVIWTGITLLIPLTSLIIFLFVFILFFPRNSSLNPHQMTQGYKCKSPCTIFIYCILLKRANKCHYFPSILLISANVFPFVSGCSKSTSMDPVKLNTEKRYMVPYIPSIFIRVGRVLIATKAQIHKIDMQSVVVKALIWKRDTSLVTFLYTRSSMALSPSPAWFRTGLKTAVSKHPMML